MGLTRRDEAEVARLKARILGGSVTREDWSNLAALNMLMQPDEAVFAIAAQGFDKFLSIAGPLYEGHGFHFHDFCHIYTRICRAVAEAPVS